MEFWHPGAEKAFQAPTYFRNEKEWKPLEQFDELQIQDIYDLVLKIPNNKGRVGMQRLQQNGITSKRNKLRRWIPCNLGKLDRIPDITHNGTINLETVDCLFRKTCRDNGIVCIKH